MMNKIMMNNKLMYKSSTILPSTTYLKIRTINLSTVSDPLQELSLILENLIYSNKDNIFIPNEYEDNILYERKNDIFHVDRLISSELLFGSNIQSPMDRILNSYSVLGSNILSPLRVLFIKKSEIDQFYSNYFEETRNNLTIPELMNTSDPNIKIAVLPPDEDGFLLLALAQLLLRLSCRKQRKGNMINEFSLMEKELYANLIIKEPVDRLYKLDLKDSFRIRPIPNSQILDKVKTHVTECSHVYNLVSSFLHLHIIDDDGNHKSDICKLSKLILPLGDITSVLCHIVLMDLDREFLKRFSSIRYYRILDEIYILTNSNNDVIFDEKAGYALLEELGLHGQIESIGPGDDPLLCRRSWSYYNTNSVYLGEDQYVRVSSNRR